MNDEPPKRGRKPLGPTAKPASDRVKESRARAIEKGGTRIPMGMLTPEGVQALQKLLDGGYTKSKAACINKALIDAAERI